MSFIKQKTKDYFLLDTHVENVFINEFMAMAPGDYVKVYLYALMYCQLDADISNGEIATNLKMDLEDVLKAWNFWEKWGIIKKHKKDPAKPLEYDVEFVLIKERIYVDNSDEPDLDSREEFAEEFNDGEMRNVLEEVERLMGRSLNSTEMTDIIAWVEDYMVTPQLISYCFNYCIKKEKRSIRYAEAVIRNWSEEGFKTIEAIEEHLGEMDMKQDRYSRVFKALGFKRNPTEEEKRRIDLWFEELGCSINEVIEGCSATSGITNPSINYVDKVLRNRHKEKVAYETQTPARSEIMHYYEMLRKKAEEDAAERRRQVYAKVPRIHEIEKEMKSLNSQISRIIISDRTDKLSATEEIKKKIDGLNVEKAFLLTDNGFEVDYMAVKHVCNECRDTGILETGEQCQCTKDVTRKKIELFQEKMKS